MANVGGSHALVFKAEVDSVDDRIDAGYAVGFRPNYRAVVTKPADVAVAALRE